MAYVLGRPSVSVSTSDSGSDLGNPIYPSYIAIFVINVYILGATMTVVEQTL